MRANNCSPAEQGLTLLNPCATDFESADGQAEAINLTFDLSEAYDNVDVVTDFPAPQHIQRLIYGPTIFQSRGGDGMVNAAVAAALGVVSNDPEQTATNFEWHQELAANLLYVAGASGNANNYARSATGLLTQRADRFASSHGFYVGEHRPLLYEVMSESGELVHSGISTSCFGIGVGADIATSLDVKKPQLKRLLRPIRLAAETAITTHDLLQAGPFSLDIDVTEDGENHFMSLSNITGLELIGSKIYAKEGRARNNVNVDTPRFQPIMTDFYQHLPAQVASSLAMSGRLKTGFHKDEPIDFSDTELEIRNTSEHVLPFHTDGEIGGYWLEPGDSVRLRLARIALPVLMHR